jgi:hypothetical protein
VREADMFFKDPVRVSCACAVCRGSCRVSWCVCRVSWCVCRVCDFCNKLLMVRATQEFSCYLREVKKIEPEVLSNFDRKKYWKDYMEGTLSACTNDTTRHDTTRHDQRHTLTALTRIVHATSLFIYYFCRFQHVHDALQEVLRPCPVGSTPSHQAPAQVRSIAVAHDTHRTPHTHAHAAM